MQHLQLRWVVLSLVTPGAACTAKAARAVDTGQLEVADYAYEAGHIELSHRHCANASCCKSAGTPVRE